MLMCMQKLFEWANEAGLKGIKVSDLTMVDPDPNTNDPQRKVYNIWCKIHCTAEESIKAK